ncbi:MAG: hypothetical protein ACI89J_001910 [Hyphomicrobiaceae bacterium]|jgi:hypothetical protein
MFWKQQICRLWLGAALCVCLVSNVLGNDIWLKENELRSGLGGATIDGQYVDARGFREHYNADGSLNYEEPVGNAKLGGRWSIVRDRFCTIYDQSETGGCYRVRQVSDNCFEFFFDTRTVAEAQSSTLRNPTWTARAWRTDRVSTCEERPMV